MSIERCKAGDLLLGIHEATSPYLILERKFDVMRCLHLSDGRVMEIAVYEWYVTVFRLVPAPTPSSSQANAFEHPPK